jgi:hypothetical protein
MANNKLLQATLVVGSLILAQPALAQTAFSQDKQISTADAAAKLLQPTTTDPAKSGLTTTLATDPETNMDGTDKNAYVAEGGALKLLNCNGSGISVKTYNSNDGVLLIPYQTVAIANLKSASPKCATSSCKLIIGSVKTPALSGYQVFVGNKVRATNSKSFTRGCPAYVPNDFGAKSID